MEQMQHTVRQHYGEGFGAHKYIERFFDLTIPMPRLKRNKLQECLPYDTTNAVFQMADDFAQKNQMEMRELTRYYAALHMMTSNTSMPSFATRSCWFCHYFLLPVAVGLQKRWSFMAHVTMRNAQRRNNLTRLKVFMHDRTIGIGMQSYETMCSVLICH